MTNQVTDSGQAAIDSFAAIATSGQYSGEVIKAAFDAALSKTKTQADAELLKKTLKELGNQGALSGKYLTDAFSGVDSKIKGVKGALDDVKDETRDATSGFEDLGDEMERTGQSSKSTLGSLVSVMRELVEEVKKLKQGFSEAGEEAEKMASKASGGTGESDDGESDGNSKTRSWASIMAGRLSYQGRDDAAEILQQMIATGDVPSTPGGGGLNAAERWREAVVNEAISRADDIQAKYDELAKYQRDIAAGDVSAAKSLLERRHQFSELETDITSLISSAASLVNESKVGSQTASQNVSQVVNQPSATQGGVYTIKFDLGNGTVATGQFDSNGAQLLEQIAKVASVSR